MCVPSGVKRGSPTFALGSCEKHSFYAGLVLYRCTDTWDLVSLARCVCLFFPRSPVRSEDRSGGDS